MSYAFVFVRLDSLCLPYDVLALFCLVEKRENHSCFFGCSKPKTANGGVNNVDKTGKTRLKQRKENVHDALLHSCQHSNLAGPIGGWPTIPTTGTSRAAQGE